MNNRQTPRLLTRKQPKQARSAGLVNAILQAAVQVLEKEGAHRFTTARVADRAGVSVGSLYQYFPNKAAILFRLQANEWQETAGMIRDTLEDMQTIPLTRLRNLVHAFIRSECEEASIRVALHDSAPFYRDAPEAKAARESQDQVFVAFMQEALPGSPDTVRDLARTLVTGTLFSAGKSFSETPRTAAEITAYADAMANMFCAYLETLREA